MFNHELLHKLALDIQSVYEPFPVAEFETSVMDIAWDHLELKDRVYRIAENLGKYLPADYQAAIRVIDKVVMITHVLMSMALRWKRRSFRWEPIWYSRLRFR